MDEDSLGAVTRAVSLALRDEHDPRARSDLLFLEAWEIRRPSDLAATLRASQIRRANPGLVAEIEREPDPLPLHLVRDRPVIDPRNRNPLARGILIQEPLALLPQAGDVDCRNPQAVFVDVEVRQRLLSQRIHLGKHHVFRIVISNDRFA